MGLNADERGLCGVLERPTAAAGHPGGLVCGQVQRESEDAGRAGETRESGDLSQAAQREDKTQREGGGHPRASGMGAQSRLGQEELAREGGMTLGEKMNATPEQRTSRLIPVTALHDEAKNSKPS